MTSLLAMNQRSRFHSKPDQFVVALQLRPDPQGFDFRKWAGIQHCKANDWIGGDEGKVHTVNADSFAGTYLWLVLNDEDGTDAYAVGGDKACKRCKLDE